MTRENSPYYAAGYEDGQRDAERVSSDPPQDPAGPDMEKDWSWMYKRGYQEGFGALVYP